ncbi:MAG TPA: glycosyltransferase family 2 protein [Anaerolineaceae bacterium]|nr:glycosyltransferase family 2 protein [Anaerolineaceae bacterium]
MPVRYPFVTVIMPIRNEQNFIAQSLGAVLAQDYPADRMEVLVADGMSDDGTQAEVQRMAADDPRVRLLDNPGRIVPVGLNIALTQAHGEIVVRVDGHCVIAPDYVRRCVEHLESDGVDGVGGAMETIGADIPSQAVALAMSSLFGVGGSAFRTVKNRRMLVETVPFPAYRMETIHRNGLFDEEMVRNQDDEYNYRLLKNGGRILLSPDIRSRYYSRSTLGKLWRQYFQYGYWKVRVLQKHPRQLRFRQFVPPVFVIGLVGSALLALLAPAGNELLSKWLFLGISGAYLAVNLAASIQVAAHNGWRYLLYLPLAFAILHVAYGSGFLVGLVKFAGHWSRSPVVSRQGS